MIYPAEPIVKPSAQKIRIASALDIVYPSETWTLYAIHNRGGPVMLITLIVNFYQAVNISRYTLCGIAPSWKKVLEKNYISI
jgi:hypothetical protein